MLPDVVSSLDDTTSPHSEDECDTEDTNCRVVESHDDVTPVVAGHSHVHLVDIADEDDDEEDNFGNFISASPQSAAPVACPSAGSNVSTVIIGTPAAMSEPGIGGAVAAKTTELVAGAEGAPEVAGAASTLKIRIALPSFVAPPVSSTLVAPLSHAPNALDTRHMQTEETPSLERQDRVLRDDTLVSYSHSPMTTAATAAVGHMCNVGTQSMLHEGQAGTTTARETRRHEHSGEKERRVRLSETPTLVPPATHRFESPMLHERISKNNNNTSIDNKGVCECDDDYVTEEASSCRAILSGDSRSAQVIAKQHIYCAETLMSCPFAGITERSGVYNGDNTNNNDDDDDEMDLKEVRVGLAMLQRRVTSESVPEGAGVTRAGTRDECDNDDVKKEEKVADARSAPPLLSAASPQRQCTDDTHRQSAVQLVYQTLKLTPLRPGDWQWGDIDDTHLLPAQQGPSTDTTVHRHSRTPDACRNAAAAPMDVCDEWKDDSVEDEEETKDCCFDAVSALMMELQLCRTSEAPREQLTDILREY